MTTARGQPPPAGRTEDKGAGCRGGCSRCPAWWLRHRPHAQRSAAAPAVYYCTVCLRALSEPLTGERSDLRRSRTRPRHRCTCYGARRRATSYDPSGRQRRPRATGPAGRRVWRRRARKQKFTARLGDDACFALLLRMSIYHGSGNEGSRPTRGARRRRGASCPLGRSASDAAACALPAP